ncbi:MAG: HAD-IA family hydrolase [Clostridiales bacterium]|nr:HAD-IA family hydrolase [Clostridiales bacterium]
MKLTHLFWDFDGTLYDSYPMMRDAMVSALAQLHIATDDSPDEVLKLLKVSVYHAACHYASVSDITADAIVQTFQTYHQAVNEFTPYDGLAGCLGALHQAGIHHYLYTHRGKRAIDQLKKDGLYHYFSDAVTKEDGFPDKPSPDALLCLMKRNRIEPNDAAMIGDRGIDISSGHHAGMRGILFDPGGYYQGINAEMSVCSMDELCKKILSM